MPTDWFQLLRRNGVEAIPELDRLTDINVRGDDSGNLLHAAIAYSHLDVALDLICRGIDVNARDSKGKTPLHYACDYQDSRVAEAVLEHGGEIGIVDMHGNTPLWSAVFNAIGSYEVVMVLIHHGAGKFAEKANKHGRSPMDFATQIGDKQLVDLLSTE